jgi:hypothetical protein
MMISILFPEAAAFACILSPLQPFPSSVLMVSWIILLVQARGIMDHAGGAGTLVSWIKLVVQAL